MTHRRAGTLMVVSAAFTALALGLSGCAVGATRADNDGPLAVYPRTSAGNDALLEGELRLMNDCVVIVGADDIVSVPVFPDGDAEWDDDELEYLDEDYAVGETVTLTGGYSATTGAYIPAGCAGNQLFVVAPSSGDDDD